MWWAEACDECQQQDLGTFRRGVGPGSGCFELKMFHHGRHETPLVVGDLSSGDEVGSSNELASRVRHPGGWDEKHGVPCHVGHVVPSVRCTGAIHTADRSGSE